MTRCRSLTLRSLQRVGKALARLLPFFKTLVSYPPQVSVGRPRPCRRRVAARDTTRRRSLTLRSLQRVGKALARGCAPGMTRRSRLPARVLSASGRRSAPTGVATETGAGQCPPGTSTARLCSALYSGWIERWRGFCFFLKTAVTYPPRTRACDLHSAGAKPAALSANCPVRPRTRPCRRQEGGLSCAATHPRIVQPGHGPAN